MHVWYLFVLLFSVFTKIKKGNFMTNPSKDTAILTVLGKRLVEQRLPTLMRLQDRLDEGEVLTEYDIHFLQEAFTDAQNNKALIDNNPESQEISAKVLHLYKVIMDKATANENARKE
jgi:hypothetical protein